MQARWNTLTAREREVARHIVRGVRNKQVAAELGISEITVKAHVSAIFRKLGVSNRVQAGLEARRVLEASHH